MTKTFPPTTNTERLLTVIVEELREIKAILDRPMGLSVGPAEGPYVTPMIETPVPRLLVEGGDDDPLDSVALALGYTSIGSDPKRPRRSKNK